MQRNTEKPLVHKETKSKRKRVPRERMSHWRNLSAILLLLATTTTMSVHSSKCIRTIEEASVPPSNADDKYHITVTLFNRTDVVFSYMPLTKYTVSIIADSVGPTPRKFTRFLMFAEVKNENDTTMDVGIFDVVDETMTKFAEHCANAVTETSKVPKGEVSVAWTSPSEGSGCIIIRAIVVETADTWYMDDSNLAVNMCQDTKAEADDQGPVLPKCCACDEAKYEVTFEGLWSRNTHPKDFPSKGWLIRFSDVIGASHTVDYRFWTYNGLASPGLKQVAELGSTRMLESELKNQSDHIRTIIKARGISYPNVTGKTFAVFRVDRKHHLMSLVSMLDPSPDWIVGVSGLELCLSNCSWIEHKQLNLYPYDAGTDDGITYLSPDSPTDPQELIRRITSSYPDDSRSPFYDPSGLDMKPLARLYLNRQRLYEKTCEHLPNGNTDTGVKPRKPKKNKACRVTSWSAWGKCTVIKGEGNKLRQRFYQNETAANENKCNTSLTDRISCYGDSEDSERDASILNTEMCRLSEWETWSSCTTSCGPGHKTRSRKFMNRRNRKRCMNVQNPPQLEQTIDCENEPCANGDLEEVSVENVEKGEEEEGKKDDIGEEVEKEEKVSEKEDEEEAEEEKEEEEKELEEEELEKAEEEEEEEAEEEEEEEELQQEETEKIEIKKQAEEQAKHDLNYQNDQPDLGGSNKWSQKCPADRYTEWSNWSPCSVSCGEGMKIRYRENNPNWPTANKGEEECEIQQTNCTAEISTCEFSEQEAEKICSDPKVIGNGTSNFKRVYFEKMSNKCEYFSYSGSGGNKNNFETMQDCDKVCGNYQKKLQKFKGLKSDSQVIKSLETKVQNDKVDCQMSEWSNWSPCRTNCRGVSYRTRKILKTPEGTGKRCPQKMKRRKLCRKMPECSSINCELIPWSSWSRCTATCGKSWQQRIKNIKDQHGLYAKHCGTIVEVRNCEFIKCPK